jgi:hypothetical protein
MADAMPLSEFRALAERKLAEATNGDLSHALFPMAGREARAYLQGRADVLQWALEMLSDG